VTILDLFHASVAQSMVAKRGVFPAICRIAFLSVGFDLHQSYIRVSAQNTHYLLMILEFILFNFGVDLILQSMSLEFHKSLDFVRIVNYTSLSLVQ